MAGVTVVKFPTPSEEDLRGMLQKHEERDLDLVRFADEHGLSLVQMWEERYASPSKWISPEEVSKKTRLENCARWMKEEWTWKRVCETYPYMEDYADLCIHYITDEIREYRGYLYIGEHVFRKNAQPCEIYGSTDAYIYMIRRSDPSDYNNFYKLFGLERDEEVEKEVDDLIEGILKVLNEDSGENSNCERKKIKTLLGNIRAPRPIDDLMIIVADRLIRGEGSHLNLTKKLHILLDKMNLRDFSYTEPYFELLQTALLFIYERTSAVNFVEDLIEGLSDMYDEDDHFREAYQNFVNEVKDETDEHLASMLKLKDVSRRALLLLRAAEVDLKEEKTN